MQNKWLKWVLLAVSVLAVYFLGAKVISFFQNLFATVGLGMSTDDQGKKNDSINLANDLLSGESLPQPDSFYQTIADNQRARMNGIYFTSPFDDLSKPLLNLTSAELIKIYGCFGLGQDKTLFGFSTFTGTLFDYYKANLNNWSITGKGDLDKMRDIWSKTGLPNF